METLSRKHTVFKTMEYFKTHQSVILVAPMQSGKTTTYFDVAIKTLNKCVVKKVVIFSGNRETMLRDQTIERVSKNEILKDVTEVVWGTDLKKYNPNLFINTLYIWDESHYGQSDDQEVDKFCAKCGICPSGIDSLHGVYCLSVSATPFSEVIDVHEEESNKVVIFQKPPKSYYGIKDMLKNDLIQSFDDYSIKMEELVCELSRSNEPKIGMFRLREDGKGENKLTILNRICDNYNISCKLYDKDAGDEALTNAIEEKPTKSHVIIVKGKLKMGKTIKDKRNVLFCMETAKKSNSDTLLQGLMGRFCGYEEPSKGLYLNKEVKFYIHKNNINGPSEYVNYFNTVGKSSPKTGMNIVYSTRDKLEYAKVEKINVGINDPKSILRAVQSKSDWVNEEHIISILKKIPEKGYKYKTWKGETPIEEGVVPTIYAGHGGLDVGSKLNYYILNGCVYLVFSIKKIIREVTTTKKEIFSKRLKMLYQNGFVIGGPRIQSYIIISEMMNDIHKLIRASLITEGLIERKIQNKEGIRISKKVYEALKQNGVIYKKMNILEKVNIKMGCIITKDFDFVVVKDITW